MILLNYKLCSLTVFFVSVIWMVVNFVCYENKLSCKDKCLLRLLSNSSEHKRGCRDDIEQQKVVSFRYNCVLLLCMALFHFQILSLWGRLKRIYKTGIEDSLGQLRLLYPGWRMRLYLSRHKLDTVGLQTLCVLSCQHQLWVHQPYHCLSTV